MARTATDNTEALADLRRRSARVAALFWAGIVAIPLGVVCPCGLAAVVHRVAPDWSQPVALSAFLLPLVGLAVALLLLGDRRRYRRSLALVKLAEAFGLQHAHKPKTDRVAFVGSFPHFTLHRVEHSGQAADLLQGTYKGRPLAVFDYSFLWLLGYKHVVSRQTVAIFTAGFESLPEFAVVPRTWADRFRQFILGEALGPTLKVPGEQDFNRHFLLTGTERKAVLRCLTEEVLDLLLEDTRLQIEVRGGMLLVCPREVTVGAAEYEDFLATAGRIARALARAGNAG
jgi:hypothetical protein